MATIRQKANKLTDRGLNAAEDGIENVRAAKNRTNRRYAAQADNFEDNLSHMAENVGRELRETYESGMDYVNDGTESARRTVQNNPLLAVAGAFIGGMVAASLFRR
jgi:hypothetical protein